MQPDAKTTPPASPTPEQVSLFQAAIRGWAERIPLDVLDKPTAFWALATRDLAPLTPEMAFELGVALGPQRMVAALTAFGHAAQHGVAEARLGSAACYLWGNQVDEGVAQLNLFFEANPLWREGAERVFEPVMRSLFLSGYNLPAPLRRKVFEYAFVAFRRGAFLRSDTDPNNSDGLRTWFMSGLPAAFQPQVAVATTLWMALGTVAALGLVLGVAFTSLSPALLPLLVLYFVGLTKTLRASAARKRQRLALKAAWTKGER